MEEGRLDPGVGNFSRFWCCVSYDLDYHLVQIVWHFNFSIFSLNVRHGSGMQPMYIGSYCSCYRSCKQILFNSGMLFPFRGHTSRRSVNKARWVTEGGCVHATSAEKKKKPRRLDSEITIFVVFEFLVSNSSTTKYFQNAQEDQYHRHH